MTLLTKEKPAAVSVDDNTCITLFESHEDAEKAIKELERSGYDMKKLSIIGTDYRTEENVIGYFNTGDRIKFWGTRGAFWGGLWGMLFGSAFFLVPGVGPLVLAGPIVGMLVGGLESAVIVGSMTALGAALYSMGVSKDSVVEYETAIKSHRFLLIAQGAVAETLNARAILKSLGINNARIHGHLQADTL